MLRRNHVVIVILRKAHAQSVGWFARLAVADVIGKDDVELRDVERLPGTEENVGKDGIQQRVGAAAGTVEQQDCVIGVACCIPVGFAEREVVQFQLRNGLTAAKAEVRDDIIAIFNRP